MLPSPTPLVAASVPAATPSLATTPSLAATPSMAATFALGTVLLAGGRLEPLGRAARRWGLSPRVVAPAVLVAAVGVGSVALLGDVAASLPFVAAAGCYLGGVLGVAVAAGSYARYRHTLATDTTPTGAVEPGFVETSGEARPADAPAETPFAGDDALCYEWRVEERRGEDWVTVAAGEGGTAFRVDDGSGPVLVDPEGAERRLEDERRVTVAADEPPPERVGAFLAAEADLGPADRDRRYVERRLPPAAEAYVLGQARTTFGDGDDVVVAAERATTHLVAAGTPGEVTAGVGDVVRLAGGLGVVAAVAGYAGMLVAAGVF